MSNLLQSGEKVGDDVGCPIFLNRMKDGKVTCKLIPQLLSRYQHNIQLNDKGIDNQYEDFSNFVLENPAGFHYHYMLPIYIDNDHFERNLEDIETLIMMIYRNVEGKKDNKFKPFMVLYILPSLMSQIVNDIVTGDDKAEKELHVFYYYYRLLREFIKKYPDLQVEVNTIVGNFSRAEKFRTKYKTPSIIEFLVKVIISNFSFDSKKLKNVFLEEYYARQVSLIEANGGYDNIIDKNIQDKIDSVFKASDISNRELACMVELLNTFEFQDDSESNSSSITEEINNLQDKIEEIRDIDNHTDIMKYINHTFNSSNELLTFLNNAIQTSNARGYTDIKYSIKNKNKKKKKKPVIDDDGWVTV